VSEPTHASLDFESTPPFGDATWLGHCFEQPAPRPDAEASADRIVALSPRGLRIEHRGDVSVQAGQHVSVHLSHDALAVDLGARVAHVADRGFRRYTLSLVFDAMTDPQRDTLRRLLSIGRERLRVA